jgi:hypothetical protein
MSVQIGVLCAKTILIVVVWIAERRKKLHHIKRVDNIQMELMQALVTVGLFFALTPGILLTLPVGNKFAVASAHGVVIVYLLERMHYMEGFKMPRQGDRLHAYINLNIQRIQTLY